MHVKCLTHEIRKFSSQTDKLIRALTNYGDENIGCMYLGAPIRNYGNIFGPRWNGIKRFHPDEIKATKISLGRLGRRDLQD